IARRRYGYYVVPFVTRKNGTLGRRVVGSRPFYPLTVVASLTVARRNHTAVARSSRSTTVRGQ
ncbi:MAG TPA: hypothetical protein VEV86_12630, partial [Vicinamibacterales bacterium]|nr:hypothetical protein [Vicinamibacterales bacterium]